MQSTRRVRLVVAFDGAAFHGWQAGRSGRGAADVLQRALSVLGVAGDLVASSRTDSGVHAFGLVAHADVAGDRVGMEARAVRDFLNAKLPPEIRVREAGWVSGRFHARHDARWKEYRYRIWNHPVANPLVAGRAWHVPGALDPVAMRRAAGCLVGRRDFHAFTSSRDGVLGDPVREIRRLAVTRRGDELSIVIRADGFLYKMCRGIVGTLVAVGRGQLTCDDVAALLDADAPRTPGMNAPAHGLVLWRVGYR